MTQEQQVLEMLRRGPVSPMDALREAGVFRLSARILDLKKQGHNIVTENVNKGGKRYAVYHLLEKKEELV